MRRNPSLHAVAVVVSIVGCSNAPQPPSKPRTGIPELRALRVGAADIQIDGRAIEPAWRKASRSEEFVDPTTGRDVPESPVRARARVLWTPAEFLLAFEVRDAEADTPFQRDEIDPHIWERASAVEIMIQPGNPGNNRNYFELQVDVAGAVWDTRFDDYNAPIITVAGNRRFGHQEWKSRVRRAVWRSEGAYTIELAIPWQALETENVTVPPRGGDVWRVNLYSFRDGQRNALAWSPLLGRGNFHRSSRFGKVLFVR
jgi:hypothetical protein